MPNMNRINAVFQKLLCRHQILIMDGRTDGRTGVTLNAPPPFFNGGGIKKIDFIPHFKQYLKVQTLHTKVVF